jgi:hypothetical protein
MIIARPSPEQPYEVVSVLGLTDWRVGQAASEHIVRGSRPLDSGPADRR